MPTWRKTLPISPSTGCSRSSRAMAFTGKPMRLNDIAEKSGIPASTAMRILNAMIENGYASQNEETQLYNLSYKFLWVGNSIRENLSLNQASPPLSAGDLQADGSRFGAVCPEWRHHHLCGRGHRHSSDAPGLPPAGALLPPVYHRLRQDLSQRHGPQVSAAATTSGRI